MSEEKNVKELLNNFINKIPNKKKLHEALIKNKWSEIMPKVIVSRTERLYLKNNILVVKIESKVLRQELEINKEKIYKLLIDNIESLKNVLLEIKFI